MHRGEPANDSSILDGYMASQCADVRHDYPVAQLTVVGDMAIGEDGVVAANHRGITVTRGAVHGHVFSEGVAMADAGPGGTAFPFQVLRFQTDGGEGIDFVFVSEFRVAVENDVGMEFAVCTDRDVFTNDAKGTDFATIADGGLFVDDGRRVDLRRAHSRSISMKVTWDSLTSSPSTEQTPLALPMLRRDLSNSTSILRMAPGRTGFRHFTFSADMK